MIIIEKNTDERLATLTGRNQKTHADMFVSQPIIDGKYRHLMVYLSSGISNEIEYTPEEFQLWLDGVKELTAIAEQWNADLGKEAE